MQVYVTLKYFENNQLSEQLKFEMSSYPAIKTQTEPPRPAGARPSPLFKDIPEFPNPRPIFDLKHSHIGGPLRSSKIYLKVIFTIVVLSNHNKTPTQEAYLIFIETKLGQYIHLPWIQVYHEKITWYKHFVRIIG